MGDIWALYWKKKKYIPKKSFHKKSLKEAVSSDFLLIFSIITLCYVIRHVYI